MIPSGIVSPFNFCNRTTTATYISNTGSLVTAQPNILRPNYVYQNGSYIRQGWIREAASYNSLTTSWQNWQTINSSSGSVTSSTTGKLYNFLNSSVSVANIKVSGTSYNNQSATTATGIMNSVSPITSGNYFSFFIGTSSITSQVYLILQGSPSIGYAAIINSDTTMSNIPNITSANNLTIIEQVGSGLYRVGCPSISLSQWNYIHLTLSDPAGVGGFSQTVTIGGFQNEAGSFSSYIPSASSTTTRTSD